MALKIKHESKRLGVTFDEAYARVLDIHYQSDEHSLTANVGVYAAPTAREKEKVLQELHKKTNDAHEEAVLAEKRYHATADKNNSMKALVADSEKKDKAQKDKESAEAEVAEKKEKEALGAMITAQMTHKSLYQGLAKEVNPGTLDKLTFVFPYDDERIKEEGLLGYVYNCLKNTKDLGAATYA